MKLRNPTVLASGILGVTGSSLVNVARHGAGAVTTKSIGLNERAGHKNPILLAFDAGLINAVGLPCPGIEESLYELRYAVENSEAPVIASLFASTASEFGVVAERVSRAKPAMIEVNISCPNVASEFGRPFALEATSAARAVEAVQANTRLPIVAKLSPNANNICDIARAVEEAGADAVSAVNTLGPGMVIDIHSAKPILCNKTGGISGPALRPIALRCVYDIYKAVDLPIIGIGGIDSGEAAIAMIMAGARAVGIGSGIYYRGIDVFSSVCKEIQEFMDHGGYSRIDEMIGIAHEKEARNQK